MQRQIDWDKSIVMILNDAFDRIKIYFRSKKSKPDESILSAWKFLERNNFKFEKADVQ